MSPLLWDTPVRLRQEASLDYRAPISETKSGQGDGSADRVLGSEFRPSSQWGTEACTCNPALGRWAPEIAEVLRPTNPDC